MIIPNNFYLNNDIIYILKIKNHPLHINIKDDDLVSYIKFYSNKSIIKLIGLYFGFSNFLITDFYLSI